MCTKWPDSRERSCQVGQMFSCDSEADASRRLAICEGVLYDYRVLVVDRERTVPQAVKCAWSCEVIKDDGPSQNVWNACSLE